MTAKTLTVGAGARSNGALGSAEVSVKLLVEDASGVRLRELIPVFHRWIRDDLIADELMIDVANYAHVPKGPGIVLVCDRAHFYFDERAGRAGLRYRARRDGLPTGADGIRRAFVSVLRAARLLEIDPVLEGRYRFRTDEVEIGVFDRLRAPSGEETLAAMRGAIDEAVVSLYGGTAKSIELASTPREPFLASVKLNEGPSVEALLGRVAP